MSPVRTSDGREYASVPEWAEAEFGFKWPLRWRVETAWRHFVLAIRGFYCAVRSHDPREFGPTTVACARCAAYLREVKE